MSSSSFALRVDHRDPGHLAVASATPTVSFQLSENMTGLGIESAEFALTVDGRTDTAVVETPDQLGVPWMFEPLKPFTRFEVKARVFDGAQWSVWSETVEYETGPFGPADWDANLIGAAWVETPDSMRRPPVFRKEFTAPKGVTSARLYFSAHGVAEPYINGQRVSGDVLTPGFTNYKAHLNYYAYDVTDLLREGENCLSVLTGDGWFRGHIGFDGGAWDNFGTDIGVIAQLRFDDGDADPVVTDESWTAGFGPVQSSGLYEGEVYDARQTIEGWQEAGFDGEGFSPVHTLPIDKTTLRSPHANPVRVVQTLKPVSISDSENGYLIDFGQNFAGTLQLEIPRCPSGTTIRARHAEVLEDGQLATRPLRAATSEDTFISDGSAQTWSPRFTIHGFRYAEISGWPGVLTAGDVQARVIHTDMKRIGHFECSNELINRFHENVVWSTKSNFVSIPTDCPQRDERLGWTGDIQVFAPTALFLFEAAPTIRDWFADVRFEQSEGHGYVPVFIPTLPRHDHFWYGQMRVSGWNDVVTLTPRSLFEATGDQADLAENLSAGKAWVDIMVGESDENLSWKRDLQLGDWLDPAAPPEDPTQAITDPFLVANAYFAASARAVADSSRDLGNPREDWDRLADDVRKAFQAAYCNEDGTMTSDTQTAYALALVFGLTPDEHRVIAGERLAELVREAEGHISTGFAGTPRILDALTMTGHIDEAFSLFEQTSCPSFLYPITMGATTTWERWDSMLPDGRVNPGDMTSFNHYALGAAASWLHRSVAGLAPVEPGWRKIRFAPTPGGDLTFAKASHETPFGLASIDWKISDGRFRLTCTVPPCVEAELVVGGETYQLSAGTHSFDFDLSEIR